MKKTFSLIYFCAAMLLIIAMTVGAFMPMMKINNLVSPYHESYSKGHFTSNTLAPAATNYGLGTVLGSIADFGDIKTVIDVQNAEQSVRDQEKVIEKIEEKLALAGEEGYSKEHYEHDLEEANKKLEKLEEKLSKKLEKITEDDENRIAAKLEK